MVDNGSEIAWKVQLNSLQSLIVRLHYSLDACTVRVRLMTVLKKIRITSVVITNRYCIRLYNDTLYRHLSCELYTLTIKQSPY